MRTSRTSAGRSIAHYAGESSRGRRPAPPLAGPEATCPKATWGPASPPAPKVPSYRSRRRGRAITRRVGGFRSEASPARLPRVAHGARTLRRFPSEDGSGRSLLRQPLGSGIGSELPHPSPAAPGSEANLLPLSPGSGIGSELPHPSPGSGIGSEPPHPSPAARRRGQAPFSFAGFEAPGEPGSSPPPRRLRN